MIIQQEQDVSKSWQHYNALKVEYNTNKTLDN